MRRYVKIIVGAIIILLITIAFVSPTTAKADSLCNAIKAFAFKSVADNGATLIAAHRLPVGGAWQLKSEGWVEVTQGKYKYLKSPIDNYPDPCGPNGGSSSGGSSLPATPSIIFYAIIAPIVLGAMIIMDGRGMTETAIAR